MVLEAPPLKHHHGSDGFAFMHQMEGVVDFLKRHGVGDQIINIDLPFHVPINNLRHIGAPARAPKAEPFQTRPVTSWKGRVVISAPEGATPMIMLSPQPRWQHSSA